MTALIADCQHGLCARPLSVLIRSLTKPAFKRPSEAGSVMIIQQCSGCFDRELTLA